MKFSDGNAAVEEALDSICQHCGGSGRMRSKVWDEFESRFKNTSEMIGAITAGTDKPPDVPEYYPCEVCSGRGRNLTKTGKTIVKFIARHWPSIQSEIDA